MKFKPEPKPKLVQPAAQVLHVVWLVQPVVIHGSLAGPACRPSAHLAGCRNIKESFLSLAGSACRLEVPDDEPTAYLLCKRWSKRRRGRCYTHMWRLQAGLGPEQTGVRANTYRLHRNEFHRCKRPGNEEGETA